MPPRDELKALFDRGRTLDQIAVHYGVAKITVGRWKRKVGLQLPTPQERRIPSPPVSKLRRWREDGLTMREIGRKIGCDGKTVSKMLRTAGLSTKRVQTYAPRAKPALTRQQFADPFNLRQSLPVHGALSPSVGVPTGLERNL